MSNPRAKRAPAAAKAAKPAADAIAGEAAPALSPPAEAEAPPPEHRPRNRAVTTAGMILSVRSVAQAGRRRAGRGFGPEPVEIDSAHLSPRQLDDLLADPLLIVIDVATDMKPD